MISKPLRINGSSRRRHTLMVISLSTKARLVAKGFRQVQGVDYDETFSPLPMLKSVRNMLAIVAFYNYEIWQMDVKTAFLNGFLKVWGCDVYVKRLQRDKLEPKSEKCVFIGYPKETIGYTFYHRSEGKIFVAKNGSFL
jgi:hypothetical protein